MFRSSTRTALKPDHDAIAQNLRLLLLSEKTSLFGDPYYGARLKPTIFEQNDSILRDLVIDEIYTTIRMFMPQLILSRRDVEVETDGVDLYATIRCTYYMDQQSDLYTINLTRDDV